MEITKLIVHKDRTSSSETVKMEDELYREVDWNGLRYMFVRLVKILLKKNILSLDDFAELIDLTGVGYYD